MALRDSYVTPVVTRDFRSAVRYASLLPIVISVSDLHQRYSGSDTVFGVCTDAVILHGSGVVLLMC